MTKPNEWEFNPGLDTPKSYAGFAIYRDLGVNRSLDEAFKLYAGQSGKQPQISPKTVPGYFKDWCSKEKWVQRAMAWDGEMSRQTEEAVIELLRQEHLTEIDKCYQSYKAVAKRQVAIARQGLEMTERELRRLIEQDGPLEVRELIALMNCLSRLSWQSLDAWAKAIGINKLLESVSYETDS